MKIVIVGGGTAGWLAALSISKAQPNIHDITVIESDEVPISGAGEGSTQLFWDFINNTWFNTGINLEDFIKECNVTPKIGIKHVNWKGDGTSYFAPLDGSSTSGMSPDVEFCKAFLKDPNMPYISSRLGQDYENKRVTGWSSFHFDAHKVGAYFSKLAIQSGVKHIKKHVFGVGVVGKKIDFIITKDREKIHGDFFIDCTGFKRSLAGGMNMKWKSYKELLPVDKAVTFQLPHNKDFEPLTTATAMKFGWMWKIPTSERYGLGYVYDSKYVNDLEIKKEILQHFDTEIKFLNEFNFESGRGEVLWKENCLTLGLASAFAEPLEATSIHTTIMQTMVFIMENLKATVEETCIDSQIKRYNEHMIKMYDDFRDFLIIHYKGGRKDTEFWRYMNSNEVNTKKTSYILDLCNTSIPSSLSIDHYFGCAGSMLYNWVLAGIGKIKQDNVRKTLELFSL